MSNSNIDFKTLPVPDLIENISYDNYKSNLVTLVQTIMPSYKLLEDDDFMLLIEAYAYEQMHKDIKLNEKVKSLLATYAKGNALDHICFTNYGTTREENETDSDFLIRSIFSLQQSTTTGSEWAYKYFAQSAHADVLDVAVYRGNKTIAETAPMFVSKNLEEITALLYNFLAGHSSLNVVIYPFNDAIKTAVEATLFNEKTKPMCDNLYITGAVEKFYTIEATIYFERYIDREVFMKNIEDGLKAFQDAIAIGRDVSLSKIYDILHKEGVDEVELITPTSKLIAEKNEVLILDGFSLTAEWSRDE